MSISDCCWRLELLHLLVERLQLALRELLALERDAREILAILRERLAGLRVELDDLLLELLLLQLQALLGRDDVGDALLDVLEQLHLLLVAVLQRLAGSSALSSSLLILALITVENRPDMPATAPPFPVSDVSVRQAYLGRGRQPPWGWP